MADICGIVLEERSEYSGKSRNMPTNKAIKDYWKGVAGFVSLLGFDSVEEFCEDDYCFACGLRNGKLARAHILARIQGGSDLCSNLHLLCYPCHIDSELIEGKDYVNWITERTIMDCVYSHCSKHGINVFSALNKCR